MKKWLDIFLWVCVILLMIAAAGGVIYLLYRAAKILIPIIIRGLF